MKYARISGFVQWSQGAMVLHEGQAADDDHPLVAERPDLWTDAEPAPSLAGPGRAEQTGEPPVERATRGPGERRGGTARG